MPPQTPGARPRCSLRTPAQRIVSLSGVTIASPTPCTARAMSSVFADVESAANADLQRLLAADPLGRPLEHLERLAEAAADGGEARVS